MLNILLQLFLLYPYTFSLLRKTDIRHFLNHLQRIAQRLLAQDGACETDVFQVG